MSLNKILLIILLFSILLSSNENIVDRYYSDYLLNREHNYGKAIYSLNKAIKTYEKLNNYQEIFEKYKEFIAFVDVFYPKKQGDIAIAHNEMAFFYKKLGDFDNGFESQKKALYIFENIYGMYHSHTALSYKNISFYYKRKREYLKALKFKRNSLNIYRKIYGDLHKSLALEYSDVGTLHLLLGNKSEALENFKIAFYLYKKELGANHLATAMTYANIGSIYLSIGNYKKALKIYKDVLYVYKEKFQYENEKIASIYKNMGVIYMKMKDYDKSWENFEKSLMINEYYFGKKGIEVSGDYYNLATLSFYMLEYSKALNYIEKSVLITEKTNIYFDDLSSNYLLFGAIYKELKNYENALKYYEKSLLLSEQVFGKMNVKQSFTYMKISELYNLTKNNQQAFHFASKAFNLFFKEKINIFVFSSVQDKINFLKISQKFPKILLSSGYKSKNYRITLNHWLNYKGSIFDSENSIATLYQNTKKQALKDKIETLTANQRTLANLYQNIPKDQKKWQEKINLKEEKIVSLTNEIAKKSSIFQEEQGLKSINYKDITKNLKNSELYIDYAKAGDYYYIFTLNKQEKIEFIQIDENRTKEIDTLVMSFRDEVQSIIDDKIINKTKLKNLTQSSKEKLARLYELLIKNPLKEQLKSKNSLIVSPDGALRLLPFETLYDKEKQEYLIENKEIRYIPSGKELVRLYKYAKNRMPKKENVMVFANPNFDSNETASYHERIALTRGTNESIIKPFFQKIYEPLRGTKLEADAIKQTMDNVEVFEWNRANETNLLNVKEPKILHIATHGFFINAPNIPNSMLKSGIILSGANKSAREKQGYGRVTALKLSGLNLKSTDLVVLSACDTGVVDINNTDSISGLGKAFIQAGAKDVVMSLWSVNDNATKELMVSFYKQIKEKPNYALALKKAKLKMIKEDIHPFYWGGFVVLGL